MSEHDEPGRLIDDADDALGELVRAAKRDVPDEARVDAMLESVLREVGGGDGDGGDGGGDGGGASGFDAGAGATGAKASGAWLATGAGKIGVALGVAAVGAGVMVSAMRSSESPPVGAPSSIAVAAAVQGTSTHDGARVPAPSADPASAVASTPSASATAAPEARSSAVRAVTGGATTATAIASAPPSASSEPADPRAELALLTEARAALSSSPARALSLAEEHARRFPSSQLGQERGALRIQALAALGRMSEARAELDAFRARNPRSAYLPTLDALLAR